MLFHFFSINYVNPEILLNQTFTFLWKYSWQFSSCICQPIKKSNCDQQFREKCIGACKKCNHWFSSVMFRTLLCANLCEALNIMRTASEQQSIFCAVVMVLWYPQSSAADIIKTVSRTTTLLTLNQMWKLTNCIYLHYCME